MSTISLRVPEEELRAYKSYASINNWSLSDAIRKTMMERIEDEYDMRVFAEYEEERDAGTIETRPIEELWKKLDL